MATAQGIEVHGLNKVIRDLQRLGVEASDLKAAFRRVGTIVVNEAKTLAPFRTGALAGSIRPSNTKNKSIVRAGGAKVPYAGVIHYGGYHNIQPHPFLTTALENTQQAAVRTLDQELHGLIRKLDLN